MKNRIPRTLVVLSMIVAAVMFGLSGTPVSAVPADATIPGAPPHINIETMANGDGTKIYDQELVPGEFIAAYAIKRDEYNNFQGNVAVTWSLVFKTGNVIDSDLVPSVDGKSAVFTANGTGSARIRIAYSDPDVDTFDSGTISVVTAASPGGVNSVTSGGASTNDKRFTNISGSSNPDGVLWEDVIALSTDIKLELHIPEGTMVLNENGFPVQNITVVNINDEDAPPSGYSFIGRHFELLPEGITFNPPVNLVIHYEDGDIPEGVSEEDLCIYYWNEELQVWESIECTVDPETNTISANLTHFSEYSVMAGTTPASFVFSPISAITGIYEGDTVTFSAVVTNEGDLSGTSDISLYIDGEARQTKTITLAGGRSTEISFTYIAAVMGRHIASIGDYQTVFVVEALPENHVIPLSPSAIIVSSLNISPNMVKPDETATVTTTLFNSGEQAGVYTIILKLDGVEEYRTDIEVPGMTEKSVSFAVLRSKVGTYTVECGDQTGQFSVISSIVPEGSIDEAGIPSEESEKDSVEWSIVGAVIGGIFVIGLFIFLIVWRRRNSWSY